MTQLQLYPRLVATGVYLDELGRHHAAGPFVDGAAEDLRASAARQRVASTKAAMLAATTWIERWEREHSRQEAA